MERVGPGRPELIEAGMPWAPDVREEARVGLDAMQFLCHGGGILGGQPPLWLYGKIPTPEGICLCNLWGLAEKSLVGG